MKSDCAPAFRSPACAVAPWSAVSTRVASGPFFANIGGFVTGLLTGLPRLRITDADPATWAQDRVVLPTGWTAVECDRLWIRGEPWRLIARHGERAELTPA